MLSASAEQSLLSAVDSALATGVRLHQWWEHKDATGRFSERFDLLRSFNPPGGSYAFFDVAPLESGELPVMGVSQWMRFDTTKAGRPARIRSEMREFVLRYFMRVSSFLQPEAYVPSRQTGGPLSWCPKKDPGRTGFGYSQLYYRLAGTGVVGRFHPEAEHEIVDLREIGPTYDWILAKVQLHAFSLTFQPFGPDGPRFALPLNESQYLLLSRHFIVDESAATRGTIGRYSLGYALLRNPPPQGLLVYGPGEFLVGFQTIEFAIDPDGSSRVRMALLVDQPRRILHIPLDPIAWSYAISRLISPDLAVPLDDHTSTLADGSGGIGIDPVGAFIDLANLLTGGTAAKKYCISMKTIAIDSLIQHFRQHYIMMTGALTTWSQVRDWTNPASIPRWMHKGMVQ